MGRDDLKDIFEAGEKLQILDVREPHEWEAGHIEHAIHVPLDEVMAGKEGDRLHRDRPVVAVCRMGNRSELATLMLRARGFDAQNMEGGMEAWEAAGLPFTASDGGPGKVV